jgi:hypothetical protein
MAKYNILLPPMASALKGFSVSFGGVPMPPMPKGVSFDAAVRETIRKEKLWQEWETWASEYWPKRFRKAALVHFTSEQPPLEKNMAELIQFWSVLDCTVQSIIKATRLESFMHAVRETHVINLYSGEEEEAPGNSGGTGNTP